MGAAIAIIMVPIFFGFAIFTTHLAGDREIGRLSNQMTVTRQVNYDLQNENYRMGERLRELLAYKEQSQQYQLKVQELEKELKRLKETVPESPKAPSPTK